MSKSVEAQILPPAGERGVWLQYLGDEISRKESHAHFYWLFLGLLATSILWILRAIPWPSLSIGVLLYGIALTSSLIYLFAARRLVKSIIDFLSPSNNDESADESHILGFTYLIKEKGYPLASRIYFSPTPIAQVGAVVAAFLLLPYSNWYYQLALLIIIFRHLVEAIFRIVALLFPSNLLSVLISKLFSDIIKPQFDYQATLADSNGNEGLGENIDPPEPLLEAKNYAEIGKITSDWMSKFFKIYRILYLISVAAIGIMLFPLLKDSINVHGAIYILKILALVALPAIIASLIQLIMLLILDNSKNLLSGLRRLILMGELDPAIWPKILKIISLMGELKLFYSVRCSDLNRMVLEGDALLTADDP